MKVMSYLEGTQFRRRKWMHNSMHYGPSSRQRRVPTAHETLEAEAPGMMVSMTEKERIENPIVYTNTNGLVVYN